MLIIFIHKFEIAWGHKEDNKEKEMQLYFNLKTIKQNKNNVNISLSRENNRTCFLQQQHYKNQTFTCKL